MTSESDSKSGTPAEVAKSCTDTASRQLVEDAANVLCWRGYIESDDDDEIDARIIEELSALVRKGELCCNTADYLADHWLASKQEEYEQSLPIWACDCGAAYKVIPEWGGTENFFRAEDNGLLGEFVGRVRRDAKGRVKQSSVCSNCGRVFAKTIARQTNPQQTLF